MFGNRILNRSSAANNAAGTQYKNKNTEADTVPAKARECMLFDKCHKLLDYKKADEECRDHAY